MSVTLKKEELSCMEESRVIRVSPKKQITIPQKFYEKLNLGDEVECILRENELVIRPLVKATDDFADLILRDLVNQGLTGDELIKEFQKIRAGIKVAAQRLIDDAVAGAKKDGRDPGAVHEDIFGDLEK